jgi:hypothetical protein
MRLQVGDKPADIAAGAFAYVPDGVAHIFADLGAAPAAS